MTACLLKLPIVALTAAPETKAFTSSRTVTVSAPFDGPLPLSPPPPPPPPQAVTSDTSPASSRVRRAGRARTAGMARLTEAGRVNSMPEFSRSANGGTASRKRYSCKPERQRPMYPERHKDLLRSLSIILSKHLDNTTFDISERYPARPCPALPRGNHADAGYQSTDNPHRSSDSAQRRRIAASAAPGGPHRASPGRSTFAKVCSLRRSCNSTPPFWFLRCKTGCPWALGPALPLKPG